MDVQDAIDKEECEDCGQYLDWRPEPDLSHLFATARCGCKHWEIWVDKVHVDTEIAIYRNSVT